MPTSLIFFIGVSIVVLLALFTFETVYGITHARVAVSGKPSSAATEDIEPGAPRALRILVATDGSPCSDRAVQSVALRPWPPGTEVQLVSVVHTNVPFIPEPTLTGIAGYEDALEEDRRDAPLRVQRAERFLRTHASLPLTTKVLEGNPAKAILEEADRWQADLLVVGSHGYGPAKRVLLGSVSHRLALHAHCSVEIVRCPHEEP